MFKHLILLLCLVMGLHASPTSERFVVQGHVTAPVQELLAMTGVKSGDSLEQVVAATQKAWLRPTGRERWEMQDQGVLVTQRARFLELFRELGYLDGVVSNRAKADYAVWLGAVLDAVRQRLMTLAEAWKGGQRFDQLVVLTGDRRLSPDLETAERLYTATAEFPIRKGWRPPAKAPVNETEMMLLVWDQAVLPADMRKALSPLIVIDTPQRDGYRPTTETTYEYWLASDPEPGTVVAFSNQPFVSYQQLIGEAVLPATFHLETVGDGIQREERICVLLDNLARTDLCMF
jgi:hypothetical protein